MIADVKIVVFFPTFVSRFLKQGPAAYAAYRIINRTGYHELFLGLLKASGKL